MRALVIYCHPRDTSFTAAVRDTVLNRLGAAGAEVRLLDLYAQGFDPRLSAAEHACYEDESRNCQPVRDQVAHLQWCDTLIFVYPTWWYGLPAMLKGWLDRVLVPGVAFKMPDASNPSIRPGLQHIRRLGVFTTCGASWWLTRVIGAPGRRTLLRGLRFICARDCRIFYAAHHLMDHSTNATRTAHLAKVARVTDRMAAGRMRRKPQTQEVTA